MPTVYNARDAGNYERLMGRWSRRLAPLFIEHAGIANGEEVLEIGCGTTDGSTSIDKVRSKLPSAKRNAQPSPRSSRMRESRFLACAALR